MRPYDYEGNLLDIGYSTPEMFGAVGDGVADDTSAVRSAINQGGIVILNGIYRCTSTIIISKSNTYIDGTGTLYGDFTTDGSVIGVWLTDSTVRDCLRIKNITLKSENTAVHNGIIYWKPSAGDDIYTDILIDGIHIDSVSGNGIHLHGGGSNSDGNARLHFNILNCYIANVGKVGICQSCVSSRIQKCLIIGSALENITIDNGCRRAIVSDNILIGAKGGVGNIGVDECTDSIIANNQIVNTDYQSYSSEYNCGIGCQCNTGDDKGLIVSGNTIINGRYGVRLGGTYKAGGIFTNNVFENIDSDIFKQINVGELITENNLTQSS